VDAVVNLAAVSNDPMGSAFAEATEQINHHGAVALAQAAKAAGARIGKKESKL
jgi:UDP-glucose 4-epimerase